MNQANPMLSKSRFIVGLQCLKRLWNRWYRYDEIPEPDPATQARFDIGHEVGELAQQLVPGGALVAEDHRRHADARATTERLLADESVPAIYEAAFTFEDIRIRADILKRLPDDRWALLEVKSSTNLKDHHIYDVAIQKYVLNGCGLDVASAGLVHINNEYVYDGEQIDIAEFFAVEDLTEAVSDLMPAVKDLLAKERAALAEQTAPEIPPGRHCHDPYDCEWYPECRASRPDFWVGELYYVGRPRLARLKELGIADIADIPDEIELTDVQRRIRSCVRSGEPFVDPAIKSEFADLAYPIHYLDFETLAPAIPRYKGTRPYETLPFQWSDHVLHEDGRLEHREWLCDGDRDPRRECAESLITELGTEGSIVHYGSFEKTRLNALIEALPHLAPDLQAVVDRLWDLLPVIRNHVCHPKLYHSFSLKTVLPTFLPEMSYDDLAIQEGGAASLAYAEMIDADTSPQRKTELRNQLLEYCRRDTLALVKLHAKCLELGDGTDDPT